MITNVYVKSQYNRLRIDKALGHFRKSDNKNQQKTTFIALRNPFRVQNRLKVHLLMVREVPCHMLPATRHK